MNFLRVFYLMFLSLMVLIGHTGCEGYKSKKSQYQLVDEPPFKVIESYSQDWVAGIEQGDSGTNLYIALDEITDSIVVQEFYFRGKKVNAKKDLSAGELYIGYFKNEINTDIIMDGDPVKESVNIPPQKIPFQLKDQEAVIGFLIKGVKHYYKLNDIEVKPPIAYPSTNPEIDH